MILRFFLEFLCGQSLFVWSAKYPCHSLLSPNTVIYLLCITACLSGSIKLVSHKTWHCDNSIQYQLTNERRMNVMQHISLQSYRIGTHSFVLVAAPITLCQQDTHLPMYRVNKPLIHSSVLQVVQQSTGALEHTHTHAIGHKHTYMSTWTDCWTEPHSCRATQHRSQELDMHFNDLETITAATGLV